MRLTNTLSYCVTKRIGKLTKTYSNLPEKYIKRATEQVDYRAPDLIQYLPYEKKRPAWAFRFTTNRPWTDEFKRQNENKRDPVFVEPITEWTVFRGDRVEVLVGRDKGKQGIVSQVIEERNWVFVGGLNWHYRRVAKTADFPGTLIRSEAPLLVTSQISLVDPSDNKTTKVEWRYTEDGDRVRVSVRSGRILPLPEAARETHDYKIKSAYLEGDKDTKKDEVEKVTFQPELKTFEMDIMDSMGIKEDRVPKKSYWY